MLHARTSVAVSALLLIPLSTGGRPSPQTDRSATSSAANHEMGRHLEATGIPNFGEVTSTLYRGGQPSNDGFETLARMGIAIVVDTGRTTRDEKLIESLGMTYVSLPWYCPFPKDKVFARFIEIMKENPGKKIFVHCRLGEDRTGMMIAAYRMAVERWTAEQAMKEMHEFGYGGIHHLVCPGLGKYENTFPERFRKDDIFENLR